MMDILKATIQFDRLDREWMSLMEVNPYMSRCKEHKALLVCKVSKP